MARFAALAGPMWIVVLGAVIVSAVTIAWFAGRGNRIDLSGADRRVYGAERGAVGTGSDRIGSGEATLGTALAELRTAGGPADLSGLVGRRVRVQADIGRAVNDVAFWTGTPPDDLLVVLSRDASRDAYARQQAPESVGPPPRGIVTLRGIVEEVPHAEATFSWGLTSRDVELLAERGVYVRAYAIASGAPHVPGEFAPAEVRGWGRETAPPPGEQNVTPLGLPPLTP